MQNSDEESDDDSFLEGLESELVGSQNGSVSALVKDSGVHNDVNETSRAAESLSGKSEKTLQRQQTVDEDSDNDGFLEESSCVVDSFN